MSEALTLDVDGAVWTRRTPRDPAANALADRHYSRRTPGAGRMGPPGRKVVFVTPCERAVWLTHWPDPAIAMDGLDSWRCAIFRNEGAGLSSELIVAAMVLTAELWEARPADGWVTWIDTRHVRSANPGYCFKRAGWELDHGWRGKANRHLLRLRAPAP